MQTYISDFFYLCILHLLLIIWSLGCKVSVLEGPSHSLKIVNINHWCTKPYLPIARGGLSLDVESLHIIVFYIQL